MLGLDGMRKTLLATFVLLVGLSLPYFNVSATGDGFLLKGTQFPSPSGDRPLPEGTTSDTVAWPAHSKAEYHLLVPGTCIVRLDVVGDARLIAQVRDAEGRVLASSGLPLHLDEIAGAPARWTLTVEADPTTGPGEVAYAATLAYERHESFLLLKSSPSLAKSFIANMTLAGYSRFDVDYAVAGNVPISSASASAFVLHIHEPGRAGFGIVSFGADAAYPGAPDIWVSGSPGDGFRVRGPPVLSGHSGPIARFELYRRGYELDLGVALAAPFELSVRALWDGPAPDMRFGLNDTGVFLRLSDMDAGSAPSFGVGPAGYASDVGADVAVQGKIRLLLVDAQTPPVALTPTRATVTRPDGSTTDVSGGVARWASVLGGSRQAEEGTWHVAFPHSDGLERGAIRVVAVSFDLPPLLPVL